MISNDVSGSGGLVSRDYEQIRVRIPRDLDEEITRVAEAEGLPKQRELLRRLIRGSKGASAAAAPGELRVIRQLASDMGGLIENASRSVKALSKAVEKTESTAASSAVGQMIGEIEGIAALHRSLVSMLAEVREKPSNEG